MNYKEGVKIASRALAIFFLYRVVLAVISLPQTLILTYEMREIHVPDVFLNRMFRGMLVSSIFETIRAIAWLLAAIWFYKCGPRIQKFFGCEPEVETTSTEIGQ